MNTNRRKFMKDVLLTSAGLAFLPSVLQATGSRQNLFFRISLAEWSLHKALFGKKMDHLDFPVMAKQKFGIEGVEYVSTFFKSTDEAYLNELLKRTRDNGVTNVLIMIDGQGNLGDQDPAKRKKAVENYHRWVDAAKYLGCHSIRVNAYGTGSEDEVASAVVESLSSLTEYGASQQIGIIVENHGGYSSNGKWLAGIMQRVNNPWCGTLPDLGNFCLEFKMGKCTKEYDRYQGVQEMMPYAKGVSAKTNDFTPEGEEVTIDYRRMLQIVKDAGYRNWIGIEYEGPRLSEEEGIIATKKLLEKYGSLLS